jgi:two-component system response regulator
MEEQTGVEILLVEDNPYDAEMTLRSLKSHNLANGVVHLSDGQQALEWLRGTGRFIGRDRLNKPKVVLLDLKLPKVDGLEVLQALRADEQMRRVPVVILTSSSEESDLVRSYDLGVSSYIVKPVDFDAFSTAMAELGHYWLLLNQRPS